MECSCITTTVAKQNGFKRFSQFKYLGHIWTEELLDDEDIKRERRALSVRENMLAHGFTHCATSVKITLIKAYYQIFYTCLFARFTKRANESHIMTC